MDDVLKPGGAYNLPGLSVINTGDETREYAIDVRPAALDGTRDPKPRWFHFEPSRFVLQPGESQVVTTRIVLPAGVEPGAYGAHLEAQPVAAGSFTVSVAAATRLTFSVEPASWLEAQRHRVNRWLDDAAPWTFIVPALLLLGVAMTRARRLPYRLRIERK